MEEVDDYRAQQPQGKAAQHHHQNINIENQQLIHTTKPLTTTCTSTSYYYPPPENVDLDHSLHKIYSGLFFNSITHYNQQHQYHQNQRPYYHEVAASTDDHGVVGTSSTTTASTTYLAVAPPGLIKNYSDGNEGVACSSSFHYMSNNCSSRWPREETMSLLQIRSRLHSTFKQATHKGPLWDEVSRIMYEEHGYQRSGKKCREKFENLYKYYKKTKEAKSGKHDGKNYRFFRQLEALLATSSSQTQYPPNSNNQIRQAHLLVDGDQEVSPNNYHLDIDSMMMNKLPCDQSFLNLSNHNSLLSQFTSSSSEDNKKRSSSGEDKKKKLKREIKEFIDIQMNSLIEQQQLCMEKVMKIIEQKEKERVLIHEKWRQQAEERLEKEHKLWANERACMKARDSALMDTLQKFTSARSLASSHMQHFPAFSASSYHPK